MATKDTLGIERKPGDVAALLDAAKHFGDPRLISVPQPDGGDDPPLDLVFVPEGMIAHDVRSQLEGLREHPTRTRGVACVTSLASFVDLVNRHKGPTSAIFCDDDEKHPSMVAVIDYHGEAPGHCEHMVAYNFPIAPEWAAWTSREVGDMTQREFAEFLEDRIVDVLDPASVDEAVTAPLVALGAELATPSRLLALSRGLTVTVESALKTAHNLSSGESELTFEETHGDGAGAPLRVPNGFCIAIPVFARDARYPLSVRLRYRVRQGKVTWSIIVHRADLAFADCVADACKRVADATGLPLYFGTAEALGLL